VPGVCAPGGAGAGVDGAVCLAASPAEESMRANRHVPASFAKIMNLSRKDVIVQGKQNAWVSSMSPAPLRPAHVSVQLRHNLNR